MNAAERYERDVVELFASADPLVKDLRVAHREVVHGKDGNYEMDATVRFELAGFEFRILVEAKLQGRPVERSALQVLLQKVQSTSAQKGVFVSSSGYQRGAVEFAASHGIGLLDYAGGRPEVQLRGPRTESVSSGRLWREVTRTGTLRPIETGSEWLAALVGSGAE
jgi:restriction system protein